MAAITPEIDASVRFSTWYEERGVARSTAFKLLALSGLELEKRRVEGSRSPVSFLSADQQEKLDFLADQLEQGKTMADLEAAIKPSRDVSTPVTKPSQDVSALADPSALVALASAMAAQLAPAPDPLTAARRIKEAADLSVWLSNDEAAAMLGVAPSTMRGYKDGHCPRPGFRMERYSEGGVWWRVIETASSKGVVSATRAVGFAGAIDAPAAVDASFRVMSSVVLPRL